MNKVKDLINTEEKLTLGKESKVSTGDNNVKKDNARSVKPSRKLIYIKNEKMRGTIQIVQTKTWKKTLKEQILRDIREIEHNKAIENGNKKAEEVLEAAIKNIYTCDIWEITFENGELIENKIIELKKVIGERNGK